MTGWFSIASQVKSFHEECLKYKKGTLGFFYYSNIVSLLLADLDERGADAKFISRIIPGFNLADYLAPSLVDLHQELKSGEDEVVMYTIPFVPDED